MSELKQQKQRWADTPAAQRAAIVGRLLAEVQRAAPGWVAASLDAKAVAPDSPRAGVACYRQVLAALRGRRMHVFFPLEFRVVKGDDIWLSPFFGRDSVSISVHQHHRRQYERLFGALEPVFWRFGGRPHWGKIHTLAAAQFAGLYPRWRDFMELRRELDLEGKFLNRHLRSCFGLPVSAAPISAAPWRQLPVSELDR